MPPEEVADHAIDLVSRGPEEAMIGDLPDLIAKRAELIAGPGRARGGRDRAHADLCRARRARRARRRADGRARRRRGRPRRHPHPQPDRLFRAAVRLRQAGRDPGAAELADAARRARRADRRRRAGPALPRRGRGRRPPPRLAAPLPAIDFDGDYEAGARRGAAGTGSRRAGRPGRPGICSTRRGRPAGPRA